MQLRIFYFYFLLSGALVEQANHPTWGRVVSYLLNSGRIQPPDRGRDVGDHPPITPMRAAPRDEFAKGNEWKIYDYVTRYRIAPSPPCGPHPGTSLPRATSGRSTITSPGKDNHLRGCRDLTDERGSRGDTGMRGSFRLRRRWFCCCCYFRDVFLETLISLDHQ